MSSSLVLPRTGYTKRPQSFVGVVLNFHLHSCKPKRNKMQILWPLLLHKPFILTLLLSRDTRLVYWFGTSLSGSISFSSCPPFKYSTSEIILLNKKSTCIITLYKPSLLKSIKQDDNKATL